MALVGRKMAPVPLKSLNFAFIGVNYTAIGTPFGVPIRIMTFLNNTDDAVYISFDGVDDHIALTSDTYMVLDVSANKDDINGACYFPIGTQLYVKQGSGLAPTQGAVIVGGFYTAA